MECICGSTLNVYICVNADEDTVEIKISCDKCGILLHFLTGGLKEVLSYDIME